LGNRWWMIVPTNDRLGSVIARSWATPYTRRTSCHEQKNRDAAWKVIFVLFHEKSHLTPNLTPRFPSAHGGRYQDGTPPSTSILLPSTCCAKFALDTQGQIPLYSHPSEASLYHLTNGNSSSAAWKSETPRRRSAIGHRAPTALSHGTNMSVGCYCAEEVRCHGSVLKALLKEHGAEVV